MKIWTSSHKADDKLIAYTDYAIYKGHAKLVDADKVAFELSTLKYIPKDLTGIPLPYIKEINLQEGKKYIELVFGRDSSEELKITDDKTRQEIFDYFKANIPAAQYSLVRTSALQAGKKPLIACFVVGAIFAWTLHIATGIESGDDYDVTGQRYHSIAGIVLALASLGVTKVILLFGTVLLIALYSFIKKARKPPVINRLVLHR